MFPSSSSSDRFDPNALVGTSSDDSDTLLGTSFERCYGAPKIIRPLVKRSADPRSAGGVIYESRCGMSDTAPSTIKQPGVISTLGLSAGSMGSSLHGECLVTGLPYSHYAMKPLHGSSGSPLHVSAREIKVPLVLEAREMLCGRTSWQIRSC